MAMAIRFDGKVAIVTGAGAGLGRTYALELARRGAKVLVNDLGGSTSGEGQSLQAADSVVAEIKALGGVAAANYDSVVHGDRIVESAIKAFGRVDIVINNAGILRDRSFARMADKDWDLILDVHLKGTFSVTRAAWPYMRKQGYGRVITTSSGSGLYGNFGQSNYSAAKMGIIGFTTAIAKEGAKSNIYSNVVVPVAASRLTATVLPAESLQMYPPEKVSSVVMYLCHESCKENGSILEVGGGLVNKWRWQRSKGAGFKGAFTAEDIVQNWAQVTDYSQPDHPSSPMDMMKRITALVSPQAKL